MLFLNFWIENSKEIIISSIFALIIIFLLVLFSVFQTREKKKTRTILISLLMVLVILFGVSFSIYANFTKAAQEAALNGDPIIEVPYIKIALIDLFIVVAYVGFTLLVQKSQRKKAQEKATTKIASVSILIALASVLMMMSIPIFPSFPQLKLELSCLVLFMVLLWYDFKTVIVVSLLTNFIHAWMPTATAPLIPFLDEGVNFIATMAFLLPSAIFFRNLKENQKPARVNVILATIIGTTFTLVFMVLFNYYLNLPVIYHISGWSLQNVITIFGLFNIIKWGAVTVAINLIWSRLFNIKYLVNM
jgi:riboflavin transporter FmnP